MNPRDMPDEVKRALRTSELVRMREARVGAMLRSGFGMPSQNARAAGVPPPCDETSIDSVQAPEISATAVTVSIARAPEQAALARELVRKRYTQRGYRMVEDSGIPFPTPARSPHFFPIIATACDRIVGTVTLGSDSPAGLMVDDAHKSIVDQIRTEGGHVCELVRLALEDSVDSKLVLTTLFDYVHQMSVNILELTDLLIEVIPQHANYYCKLFGFSRASSIRLCERVGGVKSVLLRLRRADIEARLAYI